MKWFAMTHWGQWYITEWVKFRIANVLDRKPSRCWGSLAAWALNLDPWWAIFALWWPERHPFSLYTFEQSCRWANNEQAPWCGKCWDADRWLMECTPEQRREALEKYPERQA